MFTEDFGPFFDSDVFAEAATVNGVVRSVIFSDGTVVDVGVETAAPYILLPTNETTGLSYGDSVTVSAQTFEIVGFDHSGKGITKIYLGRTSG